MRALTALFAVLALLFAADPAAAASPKRGPWSEPFPSYDLLCGYRIIYDQTLHVSLAATMKDGTPVIILDMRLSVDEEQPRRAFLAAHECAHHQMGHAAPENLRRRVLSEAVVRDQELSADCMAAEMLSRLGLYKTVRLVADGFHRGGLYSPGGGYPGGVQRGQIIRECAKVGLAAWRQDAADALLIEIPPQD